MSDYFGALLRSAGAVPAVSPARATPAPQADLVEQQVDLEIGTAPESVAAASPPDAAAGEETALRAPTPSFPGPPAEMRRDPAGELRKRAALDGEVHPAVRVALEWVAADPKPVERVVSDVLRPAIGPSSREHSPSLTTPSGPDVLPDAQAVAAVQPATSIRPVPASTSSSIEHDIEREAERQPAWSERSSIRDRPPAVQHTARARQDVVARLDRAEPAPPESIEVHIGSIHVRVDAPPAPRTVVQPAPLPSRPSPDARSADRGSFGRSRLPRL